jgi:hypothetical protein
MGGEDRRDAVDPRGEAAQDSGFGRVGVNQIRTGSSQEGADFAEGGEIVERRNRLNEVRQDVADRAQLTSLFKQEAVFARCHLDVAMRPEAANEIENVDLGAAALGTSNEV